MSDLLADAVAQIKAERSRLLARIAQLDRVLRALDGVALDGEAPVTPRRARRSGTTVDHALRILAEHGSPMHFAEIHAAVGRSLGRSVNYSTLSHNLSQQARLGAIVRHKAGLYSARMSTGA